MLEKLPSRLSPRLTFICLVRVFSCLSRAAFCSSSFITLPRNKEVRQEVAELRDSWGKVRKAAKEQLRVRQQR